MSGALRAFVDDGPPRVVFAPGSESSVADELVALGAERVLVISTPRRKGADRLAAALGDRCVGVFDQAQPQVPLAVAAEVRHVSRDLAVDWVVAHGGGTPIGTAKAIALEVDVKIAAIPTTYAGSEMTDIYGITFEGEKTTGRAPQVRPSLVVYDPHLVATLPTHLATTSLFNALAHSIEGLYDPEARSEVRAQAEESVRLLIGALRRFGAPDQLDLVTMADAQYGAYLAGRVLQDARMALHHKLAHVLGGAFDTPHAPTHAALLPYTLAHNTPGASGAMACLREALEAEDPVAALWDLIDHLQLPLRLSRFGVGLDSIDRCVELGTRQPYPNPIPITEEGLRRTLQDAVLGRRPSAEVGRLGLAGVSGPHAGLGAAHAGAELADADRVIIAVHGRDSTAEAMLREIDRRSEEHAWIALQAADNAWYAEGWRDVPADHEGLRSAFSAIDAAIALARAHVPLERICLLGWSQGAFVALSWLSHTSEPPPQVVAWTGGVIPSVGPFTGLEGVNVYVGTATRDPWVTMAEVAEAVRALKSGGASVTLHTEDTDDHGIHEADQQALRDAIEAIGPPAA